MSTVSTTITAEQLFAMGDIGRCELVRGELIRMSPAGHNHGDIALTIGAFIKVFVREHDLGKAYGAETGFIIARNPDTVRAPDVAFVRKDRLRAVAKRGFFPGAPDLAVEVLSPDDTASEVLAKVDDWLKSGTAEVWLVDPERKTIAVHAADHSVRTLREGGELISTRVLPGFSVTVAEIFE